MSGHPPVRAPVFDVAEVRRQFPALAQQVGKRPLAFLDSAASTLKPRPVVETLADFYLHRYANVHRGVYRLSQLATEAYEGARARVARFMGASSPREIVFVRGTTEAINLVASAYGGQVLQPGDEILVTGLEHHSNIVPWQLACERTGARLRVAPIDDDGNVIEDRFLALLGPRTRIVAMAHVSNALGTVNPIARLAAAAHDAGATVVVDGAQAVAHLRVDVRALGCDFYAWSGHKLYGPTGIGVLWGRFDLLEAMPPWQGGGDMIRTVHFEGSTFADPPQRFEAGTPHIAGAVGLAAAIDWLDSLGLDRVAAHEDALVATLVERLEAVPGVRIIGRPRRRAAVVSFVVDGVHAHDVGTILDAHGVAIRAGHHCAQPVMERFGVPATARASLGVYNSESDIDALVRALHAIEEIFG